ncbi:E3 ubiquitin-protein ligase sspH2 [compost metagenome]
MLEVLWPQHPPVDPQQARQVLQVAGVDLDELRGVLVDNRPAPVNLGQTLRAFDAQTRIDTFFAHIRLQTLMPSDSELLAWSEGRPEAGKGLAQVLAHEPELRPQLFAHLTQQPFADDPLTVQVRQAFPGLPSAYVREVVGRAGEFEYEMARVEQRLPLSCAKNARSLLRLARLNRALAGLYLGAAYSDETGELVFTLLDSLELDGLSIGLRDDAVDGRPIKQAGAGGQGAQDRILVRSNGRFQVYNGLGEPQAITLVDPGCIFEAIVAALAPAQQAVLKLAGSTAPSHLREQLLARLPGSQWGITRMLGWPEPGAWFNPGRRLDDGRVGYLLSGRPSASPRATQATIRERLRALYPGLDAQALEAEQARLQQGERPLLERLVELQDDYEQLVQHLNRWVAAELHEGRQTLRRATADSILRAWQLQGENVPAGAGQAQGQRLSLRGNQLRTLPQLPPQIDFHRITVLSLNDSLVSDVPVDFLRPFTALTDLNLGNNQLLRLPTGIAHLPGIRVLRLAHNQIRLDAQAIEILHGLPSLTHLDLSYNRLEALDLRFHHLSHLVSLNLRHCRLGAWPQRLELCGLLELADLRDNQLRTVPDEIRQMPYAFRRAILVARNPLSALQLQGLYTLDVIDEHGHLPEALGPIDLPRARALWVGHVEAAARLTREALWQRLLVLPESGGLFRLLARLEQTADYLQAGEGRTALVDGVWNLLAALDGDPVLCRRVCERAGLPLSCSDAVASCFSALRVLVMQAQAEADAANLENRAALLELGRQLFRLEQLERVAWRDCRQRLAAGEHFDQMALGLAYRVRLRARLQLPAQPYAMRYPDATELSEAQVEEAFGQVTRAQRLEALTESLGQREFWRRYLRRHHGRMFDAISADYVQRTLRLQARQLQLSPLEFQDQLNRLAEQELAEAERLVSGLTQSYLQAAERGEG